MLIGLVGRIATDGFDSGIDEDYHFRTAKQDGLEPTFRVARFAWYQ